jgi:hypothetical protein
MNAEKWFRLSIIVGLICYVAYWFLPFSYDYLDSEKAAILSYAGYDALYPGSFAVSIVLLVAWITAAAGMLFYKREGRALFLVLVIATAAMTPLYGLSIELAGGATLLDIANIADGFAIGLAYFSPQVSSRFYTLF